MAATQMPDTASSAFNTVRCLITRTTMMTPSISVNAAQGSRSTYRLNRNQSQNCALHAYVSMTDDMLSTHVPRTTTHVAHKIPYRYYIPRSIQSRLNAPSETPATPKSGQNLGGILDQSTVGHSVGRGQRDINFAGGHAHPTAYRKLGTGDGVTLAAAVTAGVVGAERHGAGVVGEVPALAAALARAECGVVGDIKYGAASSIRVGEAPLFSTS